jgi:hypothetical protein
LLYKLLFLILRPVAKLVAGRVSFPAKNSITKQMSMEIKKTPVLLQAEDMDKGFDVSRRRFLQLAGGITGAGVLLSACHPRSGTKSVYLGAEDTALLNYLYILEQIESMFYIQAVKTIYLNISALELTLLTDVRDQEIAHCEFIQALLGPNAIPAIAPDFSGVTFTDRTSVLTNAAAIEDMVIAAYNGCATLFTNTSYTFALTKMVTVEARHSAYFRDMLTYNSFADATVISTNGLDGSVTPATGLSMAKQYTQTLFDSSKLPN